ncbi:hypothetical protein QW180_22485 [Vibrio sinaloensis]|nr:hypothetical protein [Vibrio sinaloensis]
MGCNTAIGIASISKPSRRVASPLFMPPLSITKNARETLTRFAEWNLRFEQKRRPDYADLFHG